MNTETQFLDPDPGAVVPVPRAEARKTRLAAFCGGYCMPRSEHLIPFRT